MVLMTTDDSGWWQGEKIDGGGHGTGEIGFFPYT